MGTPPLPLARGQQGSGRPRALGFSDGVSAFFGGIGFIVGRPSMWGWALIPVVVATALFLGIGGLFIWAGSDLAQRIVTDDGGLRTVGLWALRIVLAIVSVIVAFLLATSLAQPIAGFALDAIARRQEVALAGAGAPRWPNQPLVASSLRALRVTLSALAFSVPLLGLLTLITLLFPPASVVTIPLKFLVTGMAVAYDFLDYPLSLRGIGVRSRLGFIRTHLSAVVGFGSAAAALLLVPGLGLILLPFGVAGATRLVHRVDETR